MLGIAKLKRSRRVFFNDVHFGKLEPPDLDDRCNFDLDALGLALPGRDDRPIYLFGGGRVDEESA